MPANALKAEPVAARQAEQWQFIAYRNSSATSKRTAPHSHLPLTVSPAAIRRDTWSVPASGPRRTPGALRFVSSFDARAVTQCDLVHGVPAPIGAGRLFAASADGEHDARRAACADDHVARGGRQCTKSHCRSGRSSPSMISSASPARTRKSSWSTSQWYMDIGSPGSSTTR